MHAKQFKPVKRLGVCAPSSRFDVEKFNKGLDVIRTLGFDIFVPDLIYGKKRYLAGEDRSRAEVIHQLISDPDIDGIICARGGFGALRMLAHLNWDLIRQNLKPIIGFSDITALLMAMIQETGTPVIHGPNVVSLADAPAETRETFQNTLHGTVSAITLAEGREWIPGSCTGVLKGGNLSTLSHLMGTRFQPDFEKAILFIEDIGEPAYKIDRMLSQMRLSGIFKGVRGVITGSFENCENDEYIQEIVSEIFEPYQIPVLSGMASGHGQINLSFFMGVTVEMNTQTRTIEWI